MLKQIAWNTFKNTGNINTFMELMEVDKAIKDTSENKEKIIKEENILENKNRKMKQWEL